MTKRHKLYIAITAVLIICILLVVYLARGWIRQTLVPSYVGYFYKNGVNEQFDKTYPTIKSHLHKLGLDFKQPLAATKVTCDTFNDSESSLTYKGFRETISCDKYISTDNAALTDSLARQWHQQAPALEQYLANNGWRKNQHYNYDHRTLTALFDHPIPADLSDVMLAYDKQSGKTDCEIQVYFEISYTLASYQCNRPVSFFGGYSYY